MYVDFTQNKSNELVNQALEERIIDEDKYIHFDFKKPEEVGEESEKIKKYLVDNKNELLFSLPPVYRQHLKGKNVNAELLKTFEDNKHLLSSNAKLFLNSEKEWIIVDGIQKYRIEDTDTQLNIHRITIEAIFIDDIFIENINRRLYMWEYKSKKYIQVDQFKQGLEGCKLKKDQEYKSMKGNATLILIDPYGKLGAYSMNDYINEYIDISSRTYDPKEKLRNILANKSLKTPVNS